MDFYHLTLSKNKEKIYAEGLRAHEQTEFIKMTSSAQLWRMKGWTTKVFLAASKEDAFLLAPPMDMYYVEYVDSKRMYEREESYFFDWKEELIRVTMFQINGDGLDIKRFASFKLTGSENRNGIDFSRIIAKETIYEYVTDDIPADSIRRYEDYEIPLLSCDYRMCDYRNLVKSPKFRKIIKMKAEGVPDEQLRALYLPDFPELFTPSKWEQYRIKK